MTDTTSDLAPVRFVAYVYPGWHPDPYRPGVDEWRLLDGFRPYFAGHQPPAEPLGGRYDDAQPRVARQHIETAMSAGIEAFTYFSYRGAGGFVLDRPWQLAHEAASATGGAFTVGGTWCVRLPHDTFPVPSGDQLESFSHTPLAGDPFDRPIQQLSLRDLSRIVDGWDDSWLDVPLTPRLRRPAARPGADTARARPAEPPTAADPRT